MRIAIFLSLALIAISLLIYSLTGFRSAFEADQECHFLLNSEHSKSSTYGCDHDLETRQWLLYNAEIEDQPAKIVKRFRY
tara:strand:- start:23 stop:262 length:240 start_codon:yes stop_codon:yes gene_type:complete